MSLVRRTALLSSDVSRYHSACRLIFRLSIGLKVTAARPPYWWTSLSSARPRRTLSTKPWSFWSKALRRTASLSWIIGVVDVAGLGPGPGVERGGVSLAQDILQKTAHGACAVEGALRAAQDFQSL